jgi:hypothetical protein
MSWKRGLNSLTKEVDGRHRGLWHKPSMTPYWGEKAAHGSDDAAGKRAYHPIGFGPDVARMSGYLRDYAARGVEKTYLASGARRQLSLPEASGIKAERPRLDWRRGAPPASPTAVRRDAPVQQMRFTTK